MRYLFSSCFFTLFLGLNVNAQLGFCPGNSGDPIFNEDFGSGTGDVPLPSGSTTYTFANGRPNDGFYTVSDFTAHFNWYDIDDHTPGDTNGRMLIVNASFTPGEFFRIPISGLCENTSYEFSSWLINLMRDNTPECGVGIPINVTFEIWDSTDTTILASGSTGPIGGGSSPNWEQYALVFQTDVMQTSVILKMRNNGAGGCGNDLAIDDIVFKSCGDTIVIEDTQNNNTVDLCQDQLPYSTQLTVLPDFSVFSSHFYQWQESDDNVVWTDILGETGSTYNTPPLLANKYYRVKVAEDAVNVNNSSCNSLSEVFEFNVILLPNPPVSGGNLSICEGDNTPLSVSVSNGVIVNWYSDPVGGVLLLGNSTTFSPGLSGIYYAEAETIMGSCVSSTRTALEIDYLEEPVVNDEFLEFCENTNRELRANVLNALSINVTYLWRETGQTSASINVSEPGTYTVDVSNGNCTVTKTIVLTQIDNPVVSSIESDGSSIVVTTLVTGDFVYSLDGINYTSNNIFSNVEGGLYTVYVKERNCPEVITMTHLHFFIPKFFTPNGDTNNDTWSLAGIEFFASSRVFIFDRYGKLIKSVSNRPFEWDGTFNSEHLPTGDYWYVVEIEGEKVTGHFTLKR